MGPDPERFAVSALTRRAQKYMPDNGNAWLYPPPYEGNQAALVGLVSRIPKVVFQLARGGIRDKVMVRLTNFCLRSRRSIRANRGDTHKHVKNKEKLGRRRGECQMERAKYE